MELDDPRWKELRGGYRVPYDASHDLRALAAGDGDALDRLFENLYHQGDVGEASYAAVPMLARIACTRSRSDGMLYGLINAIEAGRLTSAPSKNPPLPDWLSSDYERAIRAMMAFALEDLPCVEQPAVVNQLLATIAFAKRSVGAGIVLTEMDDAQLAEIAAGRFES